MGRELWEIVRADELKVGDFVAFGENYASGEITGTAQHYLGLGMVQTVSGVGGVILDGEDVTVFRRINPADNPRVLRRALEIACTDNDYDLFHDYCIVLAQRELESEEQK